MYYFNEINSWLTSLNGCYLSSSKIHCINSAVQYAAESPRTCAAAFPRDLGIVRVNKVTIKYYKSMWYCVSIDFIMWE